MTKLKDIINPPPQNGTLSDHARFFSSLFDFLEGLLDIVNASIVTHPNFDTLSAQGLNPTTEANGDNVEFIKDWFVFGANNATYIIQPTSYPHNSSVQTSSNYYVNVKITHSNGNGFYFYQKQLNTVRNYQQRYITFSLHAYNHQSKVIKVRFDFYSYYDTTESLIQGKAIYLQPGDNQISSTLLTNSLSGISVGANNYTQFRLNFADVIDNADIDIYSIKCEFGKISTPLT